MEHRTLPEVVHGHGGGRGCVVSTGLSPGPGKPTTNVNGPHHHCSKQGQGSRGVVRRQQELMARADVSSLSLDLSMGLMDNQSFADAEVRTVLSMEPWETINLTSNRFSRFPRGLEDIRSVKTILLNWNRFSAFPLGVLDLSHLVHLEIGFNQLTEIPPDIGRMKNLRKLVANDNQISKLPRELGECCCLETLALDYNRLVSLPPEISNCSRLTELRLLGNPELVFPPPAICFGSSVLDVLEYLRSHPEGPQHNSSGGGGSGARRRQRSDAPVYLRDFQPRSRLLQEMIAPYRDPSSSTSPSTTQSPPLPRTSSIVGSQPGEEPRLTQAGPSRANNGGMETRGSGGSSRIAGRLAGPGFGSSSSPLPPSVSPSSAPAWQEPGTPTHPVSLPQAASSSTVPERHPLAATSPTTVSSMRRPHRNLHGAAGLEESNKSREGLRFSTNRLQRLLARCNSSTTTTSSPPRRNARDVFLSSDESPEDVEEEEEDSAEPPQQPIAGQLQTSSGSPFAEEQDQYLPPSAPANRAGLEQDEGRGGDRRAEEEEEMETDGSDGDLDALLASMSPEERRRQMVLLEQFQQLRGRLNGGAGVRRSHGVGGNSSNEETPPRPPSILADTVSATTTLAPPRRRLEFMDTLPDGGSTALTPSPPQGGPGTPQHGFFSYSSSPGTRYPLSGGSSTPSRPSYSHRQSSSSTGGRSPTAVSASSSSDLSGLQIRSVANYVGRRQRRMQQLGGSASSTSTLQDRRNRMRMHSHAPVTSSFLNGHGGSGSGSGVGTRSAGRFPSSSVQQLLMADTEDLTPEELLMVRSVVSRRNPLLMTRLERVLVNADSELERAMDESYNQMLRELYGDGDSDEDGPPQQQQNSVHGRRHLGLSTLSTASGTTSSNAPRKAPIPPASASVAVVPEEPDEYDVDIPHHFLCPITRELMEDPVLAPDGHTYERTSVVRWFRRSMKSPVTGAELLSTDVVPNFTVRSMIVEFKEQHSMRRKRQAELRRQEEEGREDAARQAKEEPVETGGTQDRAECTESLSTEKQDVGGQERGPPQGSSSSGSLPPLVAPAERRIVSFSTSNVTSPRNRGPMAPLC